MTQYTVIVPTRNRARYLPSCLASVLAAGRADVQVVVSDNSDDDQTAATRAVVDGANGPVEYARPPAPPVAMSANWEFGLRQARGKYVTVLGDDDGLLPSTFAALDRVIAATDAPAVRWPTAVYFWPDYPRPHLADTLGIERLHPSPGRRFAHAWVDGPRAVREVCGFRRPYVELPMPYNSVIRADVLGRLLAGPPPRIRAASPDVYCGLAVAHLAGRYVSLLAPLAVQGLGAKSNGAATLMNSQASAVAADFDALNRTAGLANPETLPRTPTGAYAVAECVLRFREAYPDAGEPLDEHRMALQSAAQLNALPELAADAHAAHFATLATRYPVIAGKLRRVQAKWAGPPAEGPPELGFNGVGITLRPSAAGVADVAGAARLVELVLGTDPARYGTPAGGRAKDAARELLPPAAWRLLGRLKRKAAA